MNMYVEKSEDLDDCNRYLLIYRAKIINSKCIKDGKYIVQDTYNDNFIVDSGSYRNNKRTGIRSIFKNGPYGSYVYARINYRGGKRSGMSYGYYPNNKIRYIMEFSGGRPIGSATALSETLTIVASLNTSKSNKTTTLVTWGNNGTTEIKEMDGKLSYNLVLKTLKNYFDDVYYIINSYI